ncbi:MAG TPA: DHH family phosphoesterase, partial [Chitinophagaceae bacterium]|nr:DHH family phosphoesterase [Chitinophagaceae bacterium]
MDKKWVFREFDSREAKSLQAALEMQNPVPAQLLVQRNIKTFEEARSFFRTSADLLSDPFLMKGMDRAVERIHQAFLRNEKILVYGDYDVDGTTAVAMVYSYLKKIHSQVQYYIPHRFREGYGVSELGIQWAKNEGVQLMITLDCGIKAIEQVQKANELGIDVIICDHHLPDVELPAAYAILNPKQTDCPYPYKELCGCGVGYKLISAFHQRHPVTEADPNELLDLLATAIAADIVPITGENRVMAVLGLEKANQNPSLPLKVLRDINNLKKPFTINDLVFIIAPRVNAAGRMD